MKLLNQMATSSWTTDCRLELSSVRMIDQFYGEWKNVKEPDQLVLNDNINLTLKVLNFWKFTSYCSLKPLWSGMGEIVPAWYLADPTSPLPSHYASFNCRD